MDKKDPILDRKVAERVTKNHMFMGPNVFLSFFTNSTANGVVEQEIVDDSKKADVYEKYSKLTHENKDMQFLTREFLQ